MHSKVKYVIIAVLTLTALLPLTIYFINANKPKDQAVDTNKSSAPTTASIYLLNTKMSAANEVCTTAYPVKRNIDSKNPKKIAEVLVQGPTSEEKSQGYFAPYDYELIESIKDVKIRDGVVYVTYSDFSESIKNTGSFRTASNVDELVAAPTNKPALVKTLPECGVKALHMLFDSTYKSIYQSKLVIFSFNGDIAKYYKWSGVACPGTKEQCAEKIEIQTEGNTALSQKSLLKDSIKISLPDNWAIQEATEAKITNLNKTAPINITVTKTPGTKYECAQKMNVVCDKTSINNNEWDRSQYHEMNGMVIELGKPVKNTVIKVKIETPYRTATADGMELIQKIINSIQI